MTDDERRRALVRVGDAQLARRAGMDPAAAPAAAAAPRIGPPFLVGDPVFDVRSGREGKVSHVGAPDSRGDVLYTVQFSGGQLGVRHEWDLHARPVPPAGRS